MILLLALPACKPYLEEACEAAAKKLGRTLKIGTWNGISGCYYYKTGKYTENVYFSQSGSTSEKKKTPALKNQFRPKGYDCKTGIFDLLFDRIQSTKYQLLSFYHVPLEILRIYIYLNIECKVDSDCNQLYSSCQDGMCQGIRHAFLNINNDV